MLYTSHMFNQTRFLKEFNKSGVNGSEIDRRLGVSLAFTAGYIRESRTPKPELLIRFLRAFGWSEKQIEKIRLVDWYSPDKD